MQIRLIKDGKSSANRLRGGGKHRHYQHPTVFTRDQGLFVGYLAAANWLQSDGESRKMRDDSRQKTKVRLICVFDYAGL